MNVTDLDPQTNDIRVEPDENLMKVPLQDEDHCTKLGSSLKEEEASKI